MSDDRTPHDLAGELALGVLEGEERVAALRLLATDRDFADRVDRWNEQLGPLYATVVPVEPPARVWGAITRALPANDGVPHAALRAWRGAAVGLGVLAASLAAVLLTRPVPTPAPDRPPVTIVQAPEPVLVAQLASAAGDPLLVASYDPTTGRLRVRTQSVAGNGEPELWVIGTDATPRSLGLLPRNAGGERNVDPALRRLLVAGATLALSLEPRSGAPHAAPSTTPIAAAKLALL